MKYVKQAVTREDGRQMVYFWFKDSDKCADPESPSEREADLSTEEMKR